MENSRRMTFCHSFYRLLSSLYLAWCPRMWLWMTMAFSLKNLKFLLQRKPLMFLWRVMAAQVWVLLHRSSRSWYKSSLRNTWHTFKHTSKHCGNVQYRRLISFMNAQLGTLVSPSWYCSSSAPTMSSRATVCSLSDASHNRCVSRTAYLWKNTTTLAHLWSHNNQIRGNEQSR